MDTQALTLFNDVALKGSFAAAARTHQLDPSTVSRIIANLEDELQVRLFQRSTRQMALTEAGEVYLQHIQPLLEGLNQALDAAKSTHQDARGTLTMTASIAFGQTCLIPLLPKFQKQYPNISLNLKLSDHMLDIIMDEIDLAIRLMSGSLADSTHWVGKYLFSTQYYVCVSPNYLEHHKPLTHPSDLEGHRCLTFDLPLYRSRWLFKHHEHKEETLNVPITSTLSISSALALKECAIQGMGPCLLADWLIEDAIEKEELVCLFPEFDVTATDFNTAAWMLYPSRKYVPAKTRAMINFLKMQLQSTSTRIDLGISSA